MNWKGGKINKKCLICDIKFMVYPWDTQKYCSYKCYWKSKLGKKQSLSQIEKLRKRMLENNPFKDKHHSLATKLIMRNKKLGTHRIFTEEHKRNIRLSAAKNPNFGMKGKKQSFKSRKLISKKMKGRKFTPEWLKKIGIAMTQRNLRLWQDPIFREKVVKAIVKGWQKKPNKPERLLIKLLNQILPSEYRYVGDGQFILGGKCPDFLNMNGKKKLIEFFGDYWHGKERTGIEPKENEQERIKNFKQFGFDTLVIWEKELKDPKKVENRIIQFTNL